MATATKKPIPIKKGTTFWAPLANSNTRAEWQVTKQLSTHQYECVGVSNKVQIGDKTFVPEYAEKVQKFSDADIREAMSSGPDQWAQADERFFGSIPVGTILHYQHVVPEAEGMGKAFIRCEIVETDDPMIQGMKRKMLKPVAAVGEWPADLLPKRYASGEPNLSDPIRRVIDHSPFRASSTGFFEHAEFEHKQVMGDFDPAKAEPLDLTVPELNQPQQEAARLWKAVRDARTALALNDQSLRDDAFNPGTPRKRLQAAFLIVKRALEKKGGGKQQGKKNANKKNASKNGN